ITSSVFLGGGFFAVGISTWGRAAIFSAALSSWVLSWFSFSSPFLLSTFSRALRGIGGAGASLSLFSASLLRAGEQFWDQCPSVLQLVQAGLEPSQLQHTLVLKRLKITGAPRDLPGWMVRIISHLLDRIFES